MTYLAGVLGDAASDFATAKQYWESRAGIPYTGNATTAEALMASAATMIRIANGDMAATFAALGDVDPAVRTVADAYVRRFFDYQRPQMVAMAIRGDITPEQWQQYTGRPLNEDPEWRRVRENDVAAALFRILGAGAGSRQGTAGNWGVGFEYVGHNIYDLDFDFEGMVQAAEVFAAAHRSAIVTPGEEAIAQADTGTSAAVPEGTPSGWRFNGSDGWWGPDGRFYAGNADARPWLGGTPGVTVDTFVPDPQSSGGQPNGNGGTGNGGGNTDIDQGADPWDGGGGSTDDPPVGNDDGPPNNPIDDDDPIGAGNNGGGGGPLAAGIGGMPLLLGAGLVVGLLMMKRGKR